MKEHIYRYLFVMMALLVVSCSRTTFDCPIAKGVGCESVSKVNALVDQGKLEEYILLKDDKKCKNCHTGALWFDQSQLIHFEDHVDANGKWHPPHDVYINN